jgi:valyl-tRNA synthetase
MNLEGVACEPLNLPALPTEDRWILARLSECARQVHTELSAYRFSAAINLVRDFFWDALCDWYIELTKGRMAGGEHGAEAKQVLAFCVDQVLRLLHPFVPFVTERLWQQLNAVAPRRALPGLAEPAESELLILAEYPPADGWHSLDDRNIVRVFGLLQDATRGIRDLRSHNGVPPKDAVTVTIIVPAERIDGVRRQANIVQRMAGVGMLHVESDAPRPANAATIAVGAMQIHVHNVSNDEAERKRLTVEIADLDKQIAAKEAKLANEKFATNAKPEVVEAERERLAGCRAQRETLAENLALLG